MIGFLRETLGTFLLTLLVVVAYSTAMVCLWHFMLDFLSPSWRPASWEEMALFLVWVGVHVLWAAGITFKRYKSKGEFDDTDPGE